MGKAANDEIRKNTALKWLRSFLDEHEPELATVLCYTWSLQSKAITYKELEAAILNGNLDLIYLQQWQEDYSKFVVKHLKPSWINAMSMEPNRKYSKLKNFVFNPYTPGIEEWVTNRAALFIVNTSEIQMQGIRSVIEYAVKYSDIPVDDLARAIRPMVGLTEKQTIANFKYYRTLIENNVKASEALEKAAKYASRQHRTRAYDIARSELAFAYNQGSYEGTKQAQAEGYLGQMKKTWRIADDERKCKYCNALNGIQIELDADFEFKTSIKNIPTIKKVPPAHPNCRCVVTYEEVTNQQTITESGEVK